MEMNNATSHHSPKGRTTSFEELAKHITHTSSQYRQKLIAIDGGGGAGKTTFSTLLAKAMPGSYVVKIDDFYRPKQLRTPLESTKIINPNFDWDRFRTVILDAVRDNKDIAYQVYDHGAGTLSDQIKHVPSDAPIIIEGVWSLQKAFLDYYDYRIWLEAPAAIRLERGVLRDGEDFREVWEQEWIPIDEHYRETDRPHLKAEYVINSAASDFLRNKIVLE